MDTSRIYLIRHGETAWSLSGQHTGTTDLPLTEHGRTECLALAERLRGTTFAQVFCSPRLRARQTCELAGLGAAMVIEPDLAEWNYGDYEGRRLPEILAERPAWNIFRDGCPSGEAPAEVSARVDRLIARVRALAGPIAVCTHGHLGRVLAARWNGFPIVLAQHFALGTASLGVLGYEHHDVAEPAIVHWNT